jgi:monoamine oxidase
MKKFVILGSGISGLYLGYQLLKKGHSVSLLEKEKSLGGRMFSETVEMDGQTYHLEAGAGVIRSDEDYIIDFLKELNISVNFWKSETKILYHEGSETKELQYNYKDLLKKVCANASTDISFLEAIDRTQITKEQKIGLMLGTTYSELFRANAENICQENDFTEFLIQSNYKVGIPKDGWSFVVDKIEKKIIEMGGQIFHQEPVIEISDQKKFVKTKKNQKIEYDELIVTCPYHAFKKIKLTRSFDPFLEFMNQNHHETNYLRIYSYLEEDLEIQSKLATNLSIRRVIPLSKRMIMSVYTDGIDATEIHHLKGEDLSKFIRKELKMLLGKKIPKIRKNWCFYWFKGISNWEPSEMSVDEMVEKIRNPVPSIYFCGDTYSTQPGWIEGAIHSCQEVLEQYIL